VDDTVTVDLRARALSKTERLISAGILLSALFCNATVSKSSGHRNMGTEPEACLAALPNHVRVRAEAALEAYRHLNAVGKVRCALRNSHACKPEGQGFMHVLSQIS
jgi:hypothetical protein